MFINNGDVKLLSRTRDKTCDSARDALGLMWNSFGSRAESFIYVASYGYAGFKGADYD